MVLFGSSKEKSKYTVIVGCGRLGANLANSLSKDGGDVLIIDKRKASFRKLSPSYGGLTIEGDATDLDVLKEAQIDRATVVVVVTHNDNANILIALIAREMFNVKNVIARLYDPERECVYNEFDIETICPTNLASKELDSMLTEIGMRVKVG